MIYHNSMADIVRFDKKEINYLASLMSSSMLIIPGALLGFVFGTIVFLPMPAVTGLTVLGSVFSYLFSSSFIHNEVPENDSLEEMNEKEALISMTTSFSIFIGAILGLSFGEIFLFKFMPGIWPNLEAFIGLVSGIIGAPFFLNYFIPPEEISANHCVMLSVAFEIMLYTGLLSFCLLESFPGWLSFYGWGAGLGLGFIGGLVIGNLISKSMGNEKDDLYAKKSLVNFTLPSIMLGLLSGLAANMIFEISSIYFTLSVGFAVTALLMTCTYQIVKYFGDCKDSYSKEMVHNIMIFTASFFPYSFASSFLSAGIYSFMHVYTDGLLLSVAEGYIVGASISILKFFYNVCSTLTKNFDELGNSQSLIELLDTSIQGSDDTDSCLYSSDVNIESNTQGNLLTVTYNNETQENLDCVLKSNESQPASLLLNTKLLISEIGTFFSVLITMASGNFIIPDNNDLNNITYQR